MTCTDGWSQAYDLAAKMPDDFKEMKNLFLVEAAKNNVLPIGAGLFIPIFRPDLRVAPPYKEWNFVGPMTRMPEFCAPAIGNKPNVITMDVEVPANANGVLYALGGFGGGLAAYIKDNILCYEYNLFEIQRSRFCSSEKLPAGKATIEVTTYFPVFKPGAPAAITIKVNGRVVVEGTVPITAPLLFTANDSLDIGSDTGSPVSLDYFDEAPFAFNGTIERTQIKYVQPK